jgi:hypothetical protein
MAQVFFEPLVYTAQNYAGGQLCSKRPAGIGPDCWQIGTGAMNEDLKRYPF